MKQLKHLEHLLYPVEKVLSTDLLPGYEFTKAQEYAIVVDKGNGNKKIVNHCSDIYEIAPNRGILEPIIKAFEGTDIEIKGTQRFDSRFSFDIIFKDTSLAIQKDDLIMPKLRMNNSYDGRVKWAFNLGFFRMICTNGMVVPVEGFEDSNISLKMRHTPKLGDYVDPEELVEMVENFKLGVKDFCEPYRVLQNQFVPDIEHRVQEVIEATKFPSRRAEDAVDRVLEEMAQLQVPAGKVSDWLIYNGLNFQLNHSEEISMDIHKREKLDQEVLTFLLK